MTRQDDNLFGVLYDPVHRLFAKWFKITIFCVISFVKLIELHRYLVTRGSPSSQSVPPCSRDHWAAMECWQSCSTTGKITQVKPDKVHALPKHKYSYPFDISYYLEQKPELLEVYTSFVHENLPRASITRWLHAARLAFFNMYLRLVCLIGRVAFCQAGLNSSFKPNTNQGLRKRIRSCWLLSKILSQYRWSDNHVSRQWC